MHGYKHFLTCAAFCNTVSIPTRGLQCAARKSQNWNYENFNDLDNINYTNEKKNC